MPLRFINTAARQFLTGMLLCHAREQMATEHCLQVATEKRRPQNVAVHYRHSLWRASMRSIAICCAIFCLVLGQRAVTAQDKTAHEHLKQIAWIIGDWEAETEIPPGRDDVGEAGAKMIVQVSWRWMVKRDFIVLNLRQQIGEKTEVGIRTAFSAPTLPHANFVLFGLQSTPCLKLQLNRKVRATRPLLASQTLAVPS